MKKKSFWVIGVLIVVLAVGGILFKVVSNNNKDDAVMEEIRDNYAELESEIASYNTTRNDLIEMMDNYYFSNMETDYDSFIGILKREESLVSEILEEVSEIDELCLDRLFKEKEVNNICSDSKTYYETVANVYMNDIKLVNQYINSYNSNYNKSLEVYASSVIKDYVDYNNDGVFLEREDVNE